MENLDKLWEKSYSSEKKKIVLGKIECEFSAKR